MFPIRQDRYAFWPSSRSPSCGVPLIASDYWLTAILIPFLVFALATLGLEHPHRLRGTVVARLGGFMAVGAFAAYNLELRIPRHADRS